MLNTVASTVADSDTATGITRTPVCESETDAVSVRLLRYVLPPSAAKADCAKAVSPNITCPYKVGNAAVGGVKLVV